MAYGIVQEIQAWAGGSPIMLALIMSGIAMTLTTLGGLPILFISKPEGDRFGLLIDLGLGFSSGVMIVASFTSLLLPAMDIGGPARPLAGLLLGAITVHVINNAVPHEHLVKGFEGPREALRKLKAAWLVALAIIIHNIPEGVSIGASSAYNPAVGVVTGLAIGIQDIPEGFAVALPVYASTGRKWYALFLAFLSGLSELVFAVPAALVASYSLALLPLVMGFGAGAMVYVVSHEAIPETHRTGNEDKATLAFFTGFVVMLLLDTLLG